MPIALGTDAMYALGECLETDLNPRPPNPSGSETCLVAECVSSKTVHSSKQWRMKNHKGE